MRGTAWKLFANADEMKLEATAGYQVILEMSALNACSRVMVLTCPQELCVKGQGIKDAKQIDLDIKRTYRNHFMFRDKKGIGYKPRTNLITTSCSSLPTQPGKKPSRIY